MTGAEPDDDERRWYLGLRPGLRRLRQLRRLVAEERIPALEREGDCLARVELRACSDRELAEAIEERVQSLRDWRERYRQEFIPFAHGLRTLGTYYNDLLRPEDPFEFVGLVRGEDLLALQRNQKLEQMASRLRADEQLSACLEQQLVEAATLVLDRMAECSGGAEFLRSFDELRSEFFDLEYAGERLCERPNTLLKHVLELSRRPDPGPVATAGAGAAAPRQALEQRLLAAAGSARAEEAAEMLAVGRLSWRLRDDDNLLLGRVESQLLRALEEARRRLAEQGRLTDGERVSESSAGALSAALRDPQQTITLSVDESARPQEDPRKSSSRARQLVGQPASSGLAVGPARRVRKAEDIGRFRNGDILVCDAIQPNMTHLVPLAAGIVERRGGMLIHGAIMARELGIPCVNGVSGAIEGVPEGELVTVDGDLGLVTIGAPEFRLEGIDPD